MSQTPPARLSRKTRLIYGSGDLGFALTDAMLGLLIAIFLTDVVGLQPGLAAAAIFIGRTWDYINDPIFGFISDRVRTRWGRRRPFLLFGFIPFAISFTLMWWRPPIASQVGLAVYYGLAYALYDSAATLVYMPYYALTPELSDDYDERTSLTTYRMVFSILGSMIAFILPLALIGTMNPANAGRILAVGAIMGAVSALPLLLVFLGTRERPEYQEQPQPGLGESLRAAAGNRPFLYTTGIFLFTFTGLEIIQGMLLFYLKYHMGMEGQGDTVLAALFITALVSLPFWDWAAHRWDKRRAYIAGMFFLALVMLLVLVIQPAWGLPGMLVLGVLAGVGFGCVQVLPWAIVPDVVEYDELQSGQRHEGMFYSLVTLFRKVASSFAIPLTLIVLGWTGYTANAAVQPPGAQAGIVWMMGPIPALLFLVGAIFALRLPITRQSFARVRAELERRRAQQERPE
jgi:GPH family glycoside/pentoside/hexuronide:cation symporter